MKKILIKSLIIIIFILLLVKIIDISVSASTAESTIKETNDTEIQEIVPIIVEDRESPIYKVYKDGVKVDVSAELQWQIRDLCNEYGFCEKYLYGLILLESTFKASAKNGNCIGLCQINKFWIGKANIKHFTKDYASRDLKKPEDNLLTLAEMWCYAKDTYKLDLTTRDGMLKVCYWHNTGKDPSKIRSSSYFNKVEKYANELIEL